MRIADGLCLSCGQYKPLLDGLCAACHGPERGLPRCSVCGLPAVAHFGGTLHEVVVPDGCEHCQPSGYAWLRDNWPDDEGV